MRWLKVRSTALLYIVLFLSFSMVSLSRAAVENASMLEVVLPDLSQIADTVSLNSVTVTGTRTPRLLSESPVVTSIITAEEIQKLDATNLLDVLVQELPGSEFTFGMDQNLSFQVQGLGGNSVLLLVDGTPLAGETINNSDFRRIAAAGIERIEITKGAASAIYGANAVAAVINIVTKQAAPEGWTVDASTHFSAHNEQRHAGSFGIRHGRWSTLTDVQYDGEDTYKIHDTEGDGVTTIYGNRQLNVREKATYQAGERNLLTAHAALYRHTRDYADYKDNRSLDYTGGLRWESRPRGGGNLEVSYTFDRYDKSDHYPVYHMTVLNYRDLQNSLRALYTRSFVQRWTLTVGGDALAERLMSYQFDEQGRHTQVKADAFAQAEWRVTDHWSILAALRADWLSHNNLNVSPKAEIMYKVSNLSLRGGYSRGFRAASLKERYMQFDMSTIFTIFGNEDLTPEHSHSFNISAEWAEKTYSITATGYMNLMSNEINVIWDPTLITQLSHGSMVYRNIESRNLAGADVTLMLRHPCGVSGKLSYAYFHEFPHNENNYNWSNCRPHSLTLTTDYHKALKHYDFDIMLSGRALSAVTYYGYSDTYTSRDKLVHSPAYSIWKVTFAQCFCQSYRLTLAVDNLFNYRSKTFEYNSPLTTGTTLSATLAISFH